MPVGQQEAVGGHQPVRQAQPFLQHLDGPTWCLIGQVIRGDVGPLKPERSGGVAVGQEVISVVKVNDHRFAHPPPVLHRVKDAGMDNVALQDDDVSLPEPRLYLIIQELHKIGDVDELAAPAVGGSV